jgi:hypothetical protein
LICIDLPTKGKNFVVTKRHRIAVERLEQRHLLTANVWFAEVGQELGTNHDEVELADLDGDGDLDAFLACRSLSGVPSCTETQVLMNNGVGQFYEGWSSPVKGIDEVGLGDFDRDGDLDAFFTKASPDHIPPGNQPGEVWINDGQGAFTDSGQRLTNFSRGVDIGDLDGDGDLDAITGTPGFPGIVWRNNGAGVFSDNGQRLVDWSFTVDLGDVDGDGDLDAWFGRGSASPDHGDRLYLNDGNGNFTDSGQKLNTSSTGDVALGDLDGDGDLDAYLANGHQQGGNIPDRIWMNDGKGTFTDSGQRLGRSNGRSVELGDVDADGDLDAVVANGTTLFGIARQPNVIWLNNGSGVFVVDQELGNTATTSVALGDVDRDGDLDAFFANLGDNNQLWLNTQPIAGDADRNGVFDSGDLIVVFQAGQYEDDVPGNSTWSEGDWNNDGDFDTADLIVAFQQGKYVASAMPVGVFAETTFQPEIRVKVRRDDASDIRDATLEPNRIDHVFEQQVQRV